MPDETKKDLPSGLKGLLENEINEYINGRVTISESNDFSQARLVRRIALFENHVYPTGKFDAQGDYKFWYDVISPRVDSEVKNIDFDTKNVEAYSEREQDELANIIVNLKLREYLRETGQGEEINSAIEEGAGWGNVVWKKIKGGYERVDLKNFYVLNQTAETLDDTAAIERHEFTQADLRAKAGTYDNIDEVIQGAKKDSSSSTIESQANQSFTPFYEIFERNGEVSMKDLKEHKKEPVKTGDENIFVMAKIIAAGGQSTGAGVDIKFILFAEELGKKKISDIYKEYHRSRYKGRWMREGIIELLFDIQVRANQIGNQIAKGLEWASKIIFASEGNLIYQNILTDLSNGDIIKSKDIRQLEVRMQGFDQLANEWNRLLALANEIVNSREVVQGITPTSGTPLGTTRLLDTNANKLFDFIREKLGIPFSKIFEEWIIPDLVKELKAKEILRLTGSSDMLERLYEMIVQDWYIKNLISIGPHTEEMAEFLKNTKIEELKKRPQLLMNALKGVFDGHKPAVSVIITGENTRKNEDTQMYIEFAGIEMDPVRRTALIEKGMKNRGIDVAALPKSSPEQLQPTQEGPVKTSLKAALSEVQA